MKEIWKDIEDFNGTYQVSNLGRIKMLDYIASDGRKLKGRIRRTSKNNSGYTIINIKSKHFLVHRLVAKAFIPNPNNYPQINHKDENKQNNRVDNLEWCTNKYNNNYGSKPYKTSLIHKGKKISKEQKEKISQKMKIIVSKRKRDEKGHFIKDVKK